jgi:hypothetical protein
MLVWAWFSSANESVRLLPALSGNTKFGRVDFDQLGTHKRSRSRFHLKVGARLNCQGAHGEKLRTVALNES